jgi:hypothetical protein
VRVVDAPGGQLEGLQGPRIGRFVVDIEPVVDDHEAIAERGHVAFAVRPDFGAVQVVERDQFVPKPLAEPAVTAEPCVLQHAQLPERLDFALNAFVEALREGELYDLRFKRQSSKRSRRSR